LEAVRVNVRLDFQLNEEPGAPLSSNDQAINRSLRLAMADSQVLALAEKQLLYDPQITNATPMHFRNEQVV
jgi:hypothetical protein